MFEDQQTENYRLIQILYCNSEIFLFHCRPTKDVSVDTRIYIHVTIEFCDFEAVGFRPLRDFFLKP